jgi:hypothetical protein
MDPWRDPNVAITKNPDGSLSMRQRGGNGQQQPTAAPGAAPGAGEQPGQPQPQTPPAEPATVADGKLKIGDLELSSDDIAGLMQRHALEQSRLATVPASADKYEIKLPADLKLPDGIEWSFSPDHPVQGPLLERARAIAHASGMSQDTFSQMLGLHAANAVQEQMVFQRAKAAEVAKLGALGSARVDAITTWIRSLTGDSAPQLLRVLEQAPVASTIEAFERMMQRYVSGTSGNPASGREGSFASREPPRLSDEAYGKLSYAEKTAYAQSFDQSRLRNGG